MSNEWQDVSDEKSIYLTFRKQYKKAGLIHSMELEEISKRWDLPNNWRLIMSIKEPDDVNNSFIGYYHSEQERFYLKVETNSPANAQAKSEELFADFIREKDYELFRM